MNFRSTNIYVILFCIFEPFCYIVPSMLSHVDPSGLALLMFPIVKSYDLLRATS